RRTRSTTTTRLCAPTKRDPSLGRSLESSNATPTGEPVKSRVSPPRSRHKIQQLEPRHTDSCPAPSNRVLLDNEVGPLSDRSTADQYARLRPASDRAARPWPEIGRAHV